MSTQDSSVITKAKPIHVYPQPLEFKVGLGGAFEFHNGSEEFYYFELVFDQPGPPGAGRTIKGTFDEPITVQMPNETRTFHGYIHFKTKDGKSECDPVPFIASSCVGCN